MSITLSTRDYLPEDDEGGYDPFAPVVVNPLRTEQTWLTVASCLGKILAGHLVLILGVFAGAALIVYAVFKYEAEGFAGAAALQPDMLIFYGLITMGLSSLISWCWIVIGKWNCAVNTPDRNSAKWFIFGCLVCMLLGPTINTIIGLLGEGGIEKEIYIDQAGVAHIEPTSATIIMHFVGIILSILATFLFVLYLRAIGTCFENKALVVLVDCYILFAILLIGATIQMFFMIEEIILASLLAIGVGLGFLGLGIFYLFLIFATRLTIVNGMKNIKNPLAT